MLHQTFLFLGQLWQLFEVSQILEFLRYYFFRKWLSFVNRQFWQYMIAWTMHADSHLNSNVKKIMVFYAILENKETPTYLV